MVLTPTSVHSSDLRFDSTFTQLLGLIRVHEHSKGPGPATPQSLTGQTI